MFYYFYNNTEFVITLNGRSKDETIIAQSTESTSTGDKSVIGVALALAPKSWTKALITQEQPFVKSLYSGQLKSLQDKGYVRVLTEVEYKDECKKAKLESDTGILHQDTSISSVGIYRKAAEHNEKIKTEEHKFSFGGLLVEDDNTDYEEQEVEEIKDNSRLDALENTVKELAGVVGALAKQLQKPTKKRKSKKK